MAGCGKEAKRDTHSDYEARNDIRWKGRSGEVLAAGGRGKRREIGGGGGGGGGWRHAKRKRGNRKEEGIRRRREEFFTHTYTHAHTKERLEN